MIFAFLHENHGDATTVGICCKQTSSLASVERHASASASLQPCSTSFTIILSHIVPLSKICSFGDYTCQHFDFNYILINCAALTGRKTAQSCS